MDKIADLIPKLEELERLYQLEEFKVLEQFLFNTKEQLLAEFLGVELSSDSAKLTKAAGLQARVALLSALIELPKVVRVVKQQVKAEEDRVTKLKEAQEQKPDPLDQ